MEKFAYTRLRQSEQENYQQWIIEFQFRILHFYCSEKCHIPPIFRSSPFCIWPKGVDFERYVFHILARTLHLQNKILKIILITKTPIHKWLYPWVWVVGSVFTTIWSWYTPGFILNCFFPVLAEQAVLFSIFNFLSCRFLESVSTMYKQLKDLEYTKIEKQQTESERNQFKNCSKWSVRPYPRIFKLSYLSGWVIGCGLTAAWIWYTKWFTWDYSWATNLPKRTWNTAFQSKTSFNFGSHRR